MTLDASGLRVHKQGGEQDCGKAENAVVGKLPGEEYRKYNELLLYG